MKIDKIEQEILHMPESQRAQLAQKILLSLDMQTDCDMDDQWLNEAKVRAQELLNGTVEPIPADVVREKALSLLR